MKKDKEQYIKDHYISVEDVQKVIEEDNITDPEVIEELMELTKYKFLSPEETEIFISSL